MFKKFAAEALGLSDIGVIISPAEYDKVDADDYLFHEDGEKIYFLIKSKKDEYCFTNFGLIHVDGESAVSSKRSIKRYDFSSHQLSGVGIETAGTIDLDIELKFKIDDVAFSIDNCVTVKRRQISSHPGISQARNGYRVAGSSGCLADKAHQRPG